MERRSYSSLGLILISLLFSYTVGPVTAEDNSTRYIVRFNRDTIRQMQAADQTLGAASTDSVVQAMESMLELKRVEELTLIKASVVTLNPHTFNEKLAQELLAEGVIEFFEEDQLLTINALPNDSQFNSLWGMHNSGQDGGTTDVDIDAPALWDTHADSGTTVVGVVDTGVDYLHQDLAANMWRNTAEIAGNGIDDDGNGYIDDIHGWDGVGNDGNPMDDHSHGTHCAGTIGGVGNNGFGVAGVAWRTKIMALKFLSASGSGYVSDAIEVINYAVTLKRRGVNLRVLSNSWGGGGYSQALFDAISAANNEGMLFVVAAGNSARDNDSNQYYPANYNVPNVVTVAALANTGALASFSNWGQTKVHVAAPGVSILSTVPGNSYALMSGTSMATPHVAGIATLMLAAQPHLSPENAKQRLIAAVKPLSAINGKTVSGGMINAYSAVTGDFNLPPSLVDIPNQTMHVSQAKLTISVRATDPESQPVTIAASSSHPSDVQASVSGSSLTLTPRVGFLGTVTITVSASDGSRNTQDQFTLTVHQNSAPVLQPLVDRRAKVGATVWAFPQFSDPEGDTLHLSVEAFPPSAVTTTVGSNYIGVTGKVGFAGLVDVTCLVSDQYSTTRRTFSIHFAPNEAPVITFNESVAIKAGQSRFFNYTITDPNEDYFSISAKVIPSDAATVTAYINGFHLHAANDLDLELFQLVIRANDGVLVTEKTIPVEVIPNAAPRISAIAPQVMAPGTAQYVSYLANDPDGSPVQVSARVLTKGSPSPNTLPQVTAYISWAMIEVPEAWTEPFRVELTASDGKLSVSQNFPVMIRQGAWSGNDADGDGVSDNEEYYDGTAHDDRGSKLPRLAGELCAEWNGFLGGMWNIIELVNNSSSAVLVKSRLYDITGEQQSEVVFELAPVSQRDFAVHDMSGWSLNSYGKVCSEVIQGSSSSLDGRMVYYKPDGHGGFEFAFGMPLQSAVMGKQYVPFNTFQPSLNPADAANSVANWIQLSNLEPDTQIGTLIFYGLNGSELGREDLSLPAGARRDFSAHRFGANQVGIVAWTPVDNSSRFQLRNVRYIYDNPHGAEHFAGAFQLEGMVGSGRPLTAPLDTSTGSAIVEVANVSEHSVRADVNIYDTSGSLVHKVSQELAPFASWHIITDQILNGGRGLVTVRGNRLESVMATAMHYGREENGGIQHLSGIGAREALSHTFRASYNTFLRQNCELLLVNPTAESVETILEMSNFQGQYPIAGRLITIPAHGTFHESLCERDASDRYGVVTVYAQRAASIMGTLVRVGDREQYRFPIPVR